MPEQRKPRPEYARMAAARRRAKGLAPDDPRHGSHAGYTGWGCRCGPCKDAASEYSRSRRKGLPDGDPRHGTATGYTSYGCKCDPCQEAGRRQRHQELEPGDERHGQIRGYYMGCRCDLCKGAMREMASERADRARDWKLRRLYDITSDDYEEMLAAQGGGCAICSRTCATGKRLRVDHCHTSGGVRGLLCNACNTSLGQMGDDPARLERAAAYLRAHRDNASL